jgi:hypothetical protein
LRIIFNRLAKKLGIGVPAESKQNKKEARDTIYSDPAAATLAQFFLLLVRSFNADVYSAALSNASINFAIKDHAQSIKEEGYRFNPNKSTKRGENMSAADPAK